MLSGRHKIQDVTCDVVVVGSRCAGATTALLLARAGHQVTLVDRVSQPRDAVSTHGLARGAVVALARWGLLEPLLESGAPAARKATFGMDGHQTVRPIKDGAGVDHLLAPRRYVLDALLTTEALSAGARFVHGCAVDVLREAEGRVSGVVVRDRAGRTQRVHARFVVGADGLRSSVADLVEAQVLEAHTSDTALFYGYVESPVWDGYEFHLGPSSFAGVFPTHHGQGCVWLCRPAGMLDRVRSAGSGRSAALLAELEGLTPALAGRARTGPFVGPVRGVARMPSYVRRPNGAGWALVGDAGYHRDPITGHGITDAFRDAELLARALDRALVDPAAEVEALQEYADVRNDMLRETCDLTRALAAFPPQPEFVELQRQLSTALDHEAQRLASLPDWAGDRRSAPAA